MTDKQIQNQNQNVVTKETIDQFLFGSDTKLTEQQKILFMNVAISNNLNPFNREIHVIAYGNSFNIITGYQVYLQRAVRSGQLNGWETTYDNMGTNDLCCNITIYRKDQAHPIKHTAFWVEFQKDAPVWKKQPRQMLEKVAISQGFRLAFPLEIAQLPYTADEMPSPKNKGQDVMYKGHKKNISQPEDKAYIEKSFTLTTEVEDDATV